MRIIRPRDYRVGVLVAAAAGAVTMILLTAAALVQGATSTWRPGAPAPSLGAPTGDPTGPEVMATNEPPRLAAPDDPDEIDDIVQGVHHFGWALLDRSTNTVTGSANHDTVRNTVESMIKPWIAADYLRRLSESGDRPTEAALRELALTIIDSNDPLTEKYYYIGGSDAVVSRMISICGLESVSIKPTLWSWTEMTPLDAVRYGACLADGRAAGPEWTGWVLERMREVRGDVADQESGEVQGGRWGIIDGLPDDLARQISFKNGWTLYKDGWHVNCLAVHEEFVLGIMMRSTRGLEAAADICADVTDRLVVAP